MFHHKLLFEVLECVIDFQYLRIVELLMNGLSFLTYIINVTYFHFYLNITWLEGDT